jgi:hypothetical protein
MKKNNVSSRDRFGSQIGIFNLKSYLEKVLQQKYIESIAPTLQVLENLCLSTQEELVVVRRGEICLECGKI